MYGKGQGASVIPNDYSDVKQQVSTGSLPEKARIEELLQDVHARYADIDEGMLAYYIPILGEVDPSLFAVALSNVGGNVLCAGDVNYEFSIQSISKMFVYALVLQELGHDAVRDYIGVNNTGMSFNSVMAIELNEGHPMNPMVNAGALATAALVPGQTAAEKWENIRECLSAFAGRHLKMDGEVYRSESRSNERNKALGRLLKAHGQLEGEPLEIVDIYTRQCALKVTAHDLAIMGSTLADGGVNPVTGERVISADVCRDVLAVVATNGLYEKSGEWLFEIGIPAKSGVSGGIVAMAPGKGAIGAFSPLLDNAGNSVRSQLAIGHLSRALGLNLFASAPQRPATS
ncbi:MULTISPECIES: glutaminase A [Glutamicibacter]|uniref:Glutaminase n=1 Tax=Glutamicibacter creatinolyticus TaxID=162496 RepID=A0A5B7WWK7_9MICC|nr:MULTISPECIES: glutaminase A [Glutamicibacter]QCY48287.1 Glutaminase 1 [Glutamicibacter creatinolyticus]